MPTLPAVSAMYTLPLSITSMLGTPDISLTENIVPVKLSDIENSCPDEPVKDSVGVPKSFILAVIVPVVVLCDPTNAMLERTVNVPVDGLTLRFVVANLGENKLPK